MNWDALDPSILGPALVAGLLVLSTHVPLGREVLARGIIFIDLALAQIAGLGVVAAAVLGWETHGWGAQIAAATAALVGAMLLYQCERLVPQHQEAFIGSVKDCVTALERLVMHPRMDVDLVLQYARAFKIEVNEALCLMSSALISSMEPALTQDGDRVAKKDLAKV